ncbi:MAG: STAS domain-containing protein [Opitutales bacterium]
MSDPQQPTYLVRAYSDPVVVRINGKANYLNCNNFRDFIEQAIAAGRHRILLDFENCRGMDSTFLGILAGTALELRKKDPPGELKLSHLGERNRELILNLGLQNLLTISDEGGSETADSFDPLEDKEITDAQKVLQAHENLADADEGNQAKFQDVIAFLRNQVESEEKG